MLPSLIGILPAPPIAVAVSVADSCTVSVGGSRITCAYASVTLTLADGTDEHSWEAPVWFCDPWPYGFGLLGLEGFLHHFRVTISGYEEYVEVVPSRG